MHDSDWLAKAFTLSLIGYTLHMRKQLYAILIACIGFFHMWKYSIDFYKWALWNEILKAITVAYRGRRFTNIWGKVFRSILGNFRTYLHNLGGSSSLCGIKLESSDFHHCSFLEQ